MFRLQCKDKQTRGKKKAGPSSSFKLFGYRREMNGSRVGEYKFKMGTPESEKKRIGDGIAQICCNIETAAQRIGNGLCETHQYKRVQEIANIPTLSFKPPPRMDGASDESSEGGQEGKSTGACASKNYWSASHVDDDYYFTCLSCLCPETAYLEDIIYYFVFPEYKVAVPMSCGDVILFNPKVVHCTTNPRYWDCMIHSCYVSRKTVLACAAEMVYDCD